MIRPSVGVALAGGGPLGAIWEVGALIALDEALVDLDLTDCGIFVGVSSGAFIAAGLANGITPREIHQAFIESEGNDPFEPELLLRPALGEYASRAGTLPGLTARAVRRYCEAPLSRGFFESFQELAKALPTGFLDNTPISRYLGEILSGPGRSNDFRRLRRRLFVVATDLDTGEAVEFGAPGWNDVPISRAVQASTALPGLFPPVTIRGRSFVDGVLKKTLHASVALKEGAELLLCVNPLVPFDAAAAARHSGRKPVSIARRGLPAVMSQTLRSIIHSRMEVAMSRYGREFPSSDVLLFEPQKSDAEMFFTNVFSYAERGRLSEHAYQATRADLCRRFNELAPILARHGVTLDRAVLSDPTRSLTQAGRRLKARDAKALSQTLARLDRTLDSLNACLDGKRMTGEAAE